MFTTDYDQIVAAFSVTDATAGLGHSSVSLSRSCYCHATTSERATITVNAICYSHLIAAVG